MKKILTIISMMMVCCLSASAISYEYVEGKGLMPSWVRWDNNAAYKVNASSNFEVIILTVFHTTDDPLTGELSGGPKYMISGNEYVAYSPYNRKHDYKDKHSLPITYLGQKQLANDSPDHIYLYDQMVGRSMVSATEGDFKFKHLGGVLRIRYPMERTMDVTSMVIKAPEQHFTTNGTMNVDEALITSTALCDSMILDIDTVTVEKDDTLVAYLALPPTNLENDTLVVRIYGADGTINSLRAVGCQVKAGRMYHIKAGEIDEDEEENGDLQGNKVSNAKASGLKLEADGSVETPYGILSILSERDDEDQFEMLPRLRGDVNGDGYVTMADANMVISFFLGLEVKWADVTAADVNEDGVISMADANEIISIYLNANIE